MVGLRLVRVAFSLAFVAAGFAGLAAGAPSAPVVVVVPITGMVDDGMAHLVQRAITRPTMITRRGYPRRQ